jgi:hypothetical protein
MNDIIYNTRNEAKAACKAYVEAMYDLQERLGIFETCDDSCVQTYINARFYDENGAISTYTHW